MKKYLITIQFKNINVVRMYIGAINLVWARKVAHNLMIDLFRTDGTEALGFYSMMVQELKDNINVD